MTAEYAIPKREVLSLPPLVAPAPLRIPATSFRREREGKGAPQGDLAFWAPRVLSGVDKFCGFDKLASQGASVRAISYGQLLWAAPD